MIATAGNVLQQTREQTWHNGFLQLMPAIRRHARMAFRRLSPDARKDATDEVTSHAVIAYRRLVDLDRIELAYPAALARYGVARVRIDRRNGIPTRSPHRLHRQCLRR